MAGAGTSGAKPFAVADSDVLRTPDSEACAAERTAPIEAPITEAPEARLAGVVAVIWRKFERSSLAGTMSGFGAATLPKLVFPAALLVPDGAALAAAGAA